MSGQQNCSQKHAYLPKNMKTHKNQQLSFFLDEQLRRTHLQTHKSNYYMLLVNCPPTPPLSLH